jgi:hypothetical protein
MITVRLVTIWSRDGVLAGHGEERGGEHDDGS